MIADLKPYPVMKDSSVEWLGEVPEHWEVRRLKTVFYEVDRRSGTGKEPLLSLRMRQGLVDHHAMGGKSTPPSALTRYKRTVPGEIVMNRMRAAAGLFAVTPTTGLVSPDYAVLRPRAHTCLDYFVSLFRTPQMMSIFRLESRGLGTGESGFLRLYTERFGMLCAPVPPVEEQEATVRYLDHVDRRVRRFVRAKQKLIGLLEEQKQAIIHRAVTRGLDPDVPLKDSGVEWLGEVPEHWGVVTLRRVIRSAVDGPHHSPSYVDEGIPFLSARNIKGDRWNLDDAKFISEADYDEFCRRVVPEPGDVLYTKGGTTGVARAVDLTFQFQVWVHVAVLKIVKAKITPEFLATSLNSPRCYEQSQLFTRGATNQDLGLNRMKGIYLALPPMAEQDAILAHLKNEILDLRTAIDRARREIELLREYRTRLIADVVTGKLDVRQAAASLPDERDGPEPLDEPKNPMNSDEEMAGDPDAIPVEAEE